VFENLIIITVLAVEMNNTLDFAPIFDSSTYNS